MMLKPNCNIGEICSRVQCDRGKSEKIALRWIEPNTLSRTDFTFQFIEKESNKFANLLTSLGYRKGDVIFSFLPKCPELFIVFLGILKIQAIAGMLFSNFGDEALLDRLSAASGIVTRRSLLKKVRKILPNLPELKFIIVTDETTSIDEKILSYSLLMRDSPDDFVVQPTPVDTPSVLHYTSGSTGKPKGILHVHGSIDSQSMTSREILKLNDHEVYWCTADQGWITGTSYGIIGPWSLGVTQVQYGGGFNPSEWFSILEREEISVWYTAPTALRMLMKEPPDFFRKYSLNSLKYIFSVGEPLNPEILTWSRNVLHKEIFDTWFQTETGSIMIANRPGIEIKSGSMGKPVPGITVDILGEKGNLLPSNEPGHLCILPGWSSMFRGILGNEKAYQEKFKFGYYLSGDQAYRDEDGYFWFIGRSDDIINTSGHLVSPFEVESSLLEIDEIIESGVIGAPDDLLFEKVVAFVVLKAGVEWNQELELRIRLHVMNRISALASPTEIVVIDSLPKNKSGKILRRVIKAKFLGQDPGDISMLEI